MARPSRSPPAERGSSSWPPTHRGPDPHHLAGWPARRPRTPDVHDVPMSPDEVRDGVSLTNLDQELFAGAGASKRHLVDYLDAVSERMILHLRDRPLSVMRILRGQAPFMQKNVPKYTP